jgi:hypothetical protein
VTFVLANKQLSFVVIDHAHAHAKAQAMSRLPQLSLLPKQLQRLLQFKPTETEIHFFQWAFATENGLYTHDQLRLRKLPRMGYDLCSASQEDTWSSVRPLDANEVLLKVSSSLWQPYSADFATKEFERLSPDTFASLVALSQRLLPANQPKSIDTFLKSFSLAAYVGAYQHASQDHPYLSMLQAQSFPADPLRLPHTLLMDSNVFIDPFLMDTRLHRDIMMRKNMYERLSRAVLHLEATADDDQDANVRDFLWGMGTVLSRGLSSDSMPFSMVPILDFANHADDSKGSSHNHNHKVNARHHFDPQEQCFSLIALRPIQPGESICITYGKERDTSSFVNLYGFLGDFHNGNDKVYLKLRNGKPFKSLKSIAHRKQFHERLQKLLGLLLSSDDYKMDEKTLHSLIQGQIVVQDDGIVQMILPLRTTDDAREASAQLLLWTMKLANATERGDLNEVKNTESGTFLQLAKCSADDWQSVQRLIEDTIASVYMSTAKKEAFGYSSLLLSSQSSFARTSVAPFSHSSTLSFVGHLAALAMRIQPLDSIASAQPQLSLSAMEYWKSCTARILQREMEELLVLRDFSL